jgi:hypothetical protein
VLPDISDFAVKSKDSVLNTSVKVAVLLVVVPCGLLEVQRSFGGDCCLHHQGDDDGGSKHPGMSVRLY